MGSKTNKEKSCCLQQELDLHHLISTAWRFKWLLAGLLIAAILVAGIYSVFFVPPLFKAHVMMQSESAPDIRIVVNSSGFRNHLVGELSSFDRRDAQRAVGEISVTRTSNYLKISVLTGNPDLSLETIEALVRHISFVQQELVSENYAHKSRYLAEISELIILNEEMIDQTDNQVQALLAQDELSADLSLLLLNLLVNKGDLLIQQRFLVEEEFIISQELSVLSVFVVNNPQVEERPIKSAVIQNVAVALILSLFLCFVFTLFVAVYNLRYKS